MADCDDSLGFVLVGPKTGCASAPLRCLFQEVGRHRPFPPPRVHSMADPRQGPPLKKTATTPSTIQAQYSHTVAFP